MKNSTLKKIVRNTLAIGVIATSVIFSSAVKAQAQTVKNIVLVHGAFADGSGFQGIYNILVKKGYRVTVVQNPLTSLQDDADAANRAIDKQNGPVILVGHSWGGSVITQAGVNPKVKALVYIAAFAPDQGESTLKVAQSLPAAPENGILPPDDKGIIYFDLAKYHAGFAADLSKQEANFMADSQGPIFAKAFTDELTQAAWKTKPSFAIVATEDKAINPDIERNMYKRAGAKVTEIKASHVVFISHPDAVAKVIIEAAESVSNK